MIAFWIVVGIAYLSVLAYQGASARVWTVASAVYLLLITHFYESHVATLSVIWIAFVALALVGNIKALRRSIFTNAIFAMYCKMRPKMSSTEREALQAGHLSWEAELFSGRPNWDAFNELEENKLTPEEREFIDEKVSKLCEMIDDWQVVHKDRDLTPETWEYIKSEGFWSFIIPKSYGGKEFSAYAQSEILTRIATRSITACTNVCVPNSLGPAELLLKYGTEQQKDHYLPRLASGKEIPCFALTSPTAGSDAASLTDSGYVCKKTIDGKEVIGLKLTWNKRYITLAPVATVLGLAFKAYDPEHILGDKEAYGITCALIPTSTEGVKIGRRHYPGTCFQNGPTSGKDVFIPLDNVIGGQEMLGKGWLMLMECLAAGRGVSLPASAGGFAQLGALTSTAYAQVRKQFKVPLAKFEGISEALGRVIGLTYLLDSTRMFMANTIDRGQHSSVASAITKQNTTQLGRQVLTDAMDVFGGRAVCIGPNNFLANAYHGMPVGITVEGANILTRNLIIFGQGAIRCHPYVLKELMATEIEDKSLARKEFDNAFCAHLGFIFTNLVRSKFLAATSSRFVRVKSSPAKRYYQHITRFSSAFVLVADMAMISLGAALKRKEKISGRMADVLSYMYMLSATLKRFKDDGEPQEDLAMLHWTCQYGLFQIQQQLSEVIRHLPGKIMPKMLHMAVFPFGRRFRMPNDKIEDKMVTNFLTHTATRDRITHSVYIGDAEHSAVARLEDALKKVVAAEVPRQKILRAKKKGRVKSQDLDVLIQDKIISSYEAEIIMSAEKAIDEVIQVDDFSREELEGVKPKEDEAEKAKVEEPVKPAAVNEDL